MPAPKLLKAFLAAAPLLVPLSLADCGNMGPGGNFALGAVAGDVLGPTVNSAVGGVLRSVTGGYGGGYQGGYGGYQQPQQSGGCTVVQRGPVEGVDQYGRPIIAGPAMGSCVQHTPY